MMSLVHVIDESFKIGASLMSRAWVTRWQFAAVVAGVVLTSQVWAAKVVPPPPV